MLMLQKGNGYESASLSHQYLRGPRTYPVSTMILLPLEIFINRL